MLGDHPANRIVPMLQVNLFLKEWSPAKLCQIKSGHFQNCNGKNMGIYLDINSLSSALEW